MARYNKIFAGPATQVTPQVVERPASEAITPGSLLIITSGEFALAGAATTGKMYLAQENYLAMEGVGDAYDVDDTCIGMEILSGQFFNALLAPGQNISADDALTPNGSGQFIAASTSDMVVATSEETYNNDTGAVQLVRVRVATGYLTAA